jgi:hypothetical protein
VRSWAIEKKNAFDGYGKFRNGLKLMQALLKKKEKKESNHKKECFFNFLL